MENNGAALVASDPGETFAPATADPGATFSPPASSGRQAPTKTSSKWKGRSHKIRWGVLAALCVAGFVSAFAIASINFNPQTINVHSNYYITNYVGVTAFQGGGTSPNVFFSIVPAGVTTCTTGPVVLGAAFTPIYLNATGIAPATCTSGGFAEVFTIFTNTTAATVDWHTTNFTFTMSWGGVPAIYSSTVQVNTNGAGAPAVTALNTDLVFYLVFGSFPVNGIAGFTILVSQTH